MLRHLALSTSIAAAWGSTSEARADQVKPSAGQPQVDRSGPPQSGIKIDGDLVTVVRWIDVAGGQLEAVFQTKDGRNSRSLRVDLSLRTLHGWKLLRTVTDRVDNCDLDRSVDFRMPSIGVTDLDNDGKGELTFAYTVNCAGDVSPMTLKLLVLERNDKYILRGTTRLDLDGEKMGGEFKPQPARGKWPKGFLEHATRVWHANVSTP
jgi:hypothetical protein